MFTCLWSLFHVFRQNWIFNQQVINKLIVLVRYSQHIAVCFRFQLLFTLLHFTPKLQHVVLLSYRLLNILLEPLFQRSQTKWSTTVGPCWVWSSLLVTWRSWSLLRCSLATLSWWTCLPFDLGSRNWWPITFLTPLSLCSKLLQDGLINFAASRVALRSRSLLNVAVKELILLDYGGHLTCLQEWVLV